MDLRAGSEGGTGGVDTHQPGRELAADLYRGLAVVLIVLGHWLAASVTFRDGQFHNDNVLATVPWTQWLTWLFQAVPVFFLVGGYANAVSWSRWRDGGGRANDWYRHRLAAILGPTAVYVAAVLVTVALLLWVGFTGSQLAVGTWAVAMHLWFIPVYLLVLLLTPVAVAAHRRWGLAAPAGLAVAVVIVDALTVWARLPLVGWVNYLLCWGTVYQLGIAWRGGALRGRGALTLAIAAGGALALLIGLRLYPVSMVGVGGENVQNTSPPTVALLAFAAAQSGVLVAVARPVTRWLAESRWRTAVAIANRNVMGLYLWHMIPVVALALIVYPIGLLPQPVAGTTDWWLWRIPWIAVLTVVTAAQMALMWWARRVFASPLPAVPNRLPATASWPLLLTGLVLAISPLWRFASDGFASDAGFPVVGTVIFAIGVTLIMLVPKAGAQ